MPAVFVHGAPETSALWDGVRSRLRADSVAVALPSIPNFGSAVLAGSLLLIGLLLLLRHFDLAPPWREQAAALFEGGLTGIPSALTKRFGTSAQR